jgi:hypothetical protein
VNNELEKMSKEADLAQFAVLSRICLQRLQKPTKNISRVILRPSRDSDLAPPQILVRTLTLEANRNREGPKYYAGMVTTTQRSLVNLLLVQMQW